MTNEFIYIGLLIITTMSSTLILILFYIQRKKEKHNELKQTKAELSYMRTFFEKKLIDINQKMMQDSDRWKEVNHLLLSYKPIINDTFFDKKRAFNSSFFNNFGINSEKIEVKKDQVFYLTPFIDSERETFYDVEAICHRMGFKCFKGDEEFITGDIFTYILNKIMESRIIIANIDGRNPNVFYELGIAQAIGKPTLLITRDINNMPFDIKSQNIIIYQDADELSNKLSLMLSSLLVNEDRASFEQ
ncbi:hypothetical protein [Labilibaculum sp.]|uniref:hypothetical protein n=1 Tax=Labilibaculum sp. TaxID=2060723 RepID=UPI002AA784B9|nr:hypothetical protein [Labilibaculum sp.]